jgi:hypothetical protein
MDSKFSIHTDWVIISNYLTTDFLIEPSIAITHRPYHTEMPESFKLLDDKYSKYIFGEPGLHFGVNF